MDNQFGYQCKSKYHYPFTKNPRMYFKGNELYTSCKHEGQLLFVKRIQVNQHMNVQKIPEIQILESEFTHPYMTNLFDYTIETEFEQQGGYKQTVYIFSEVPIIDLGSYVKQKGPLTIFDQLELLKMLITINYELQTKLDMPHGDLKPSNILVFQEKDAFTDQPKLTFKLSFIDNNHYNAQESGSFYESLAFKAPESLLIYMKRLNLGNQVHYQVSDYLKTQFHQVEPLNLDVFKTDTFSLGLTLLFAATGKYFTLVPSLKKGNCLLREGSKEAEIINHLINQVKELHNVQPFKEFIEILRTLLVDNPYARMDFEEWSLRIKKLNQNNKGIPLFEGEEAETVPIDQYESLKDNYFKLNEEKQQLIESIQDFETFKTVEEISLKLHESESQIQSLLKEIQEYQNKNYELEQENTNQKQELISLKEEVKSFVEEIKLQKTRIPSSAGSKPMILTEVSSILDPKVENSSFLSETGRDFSIVYEKEEKEETKQDEMKDQVITHK